jgi:hypothetical protein
MILMDYFIKWPEACAMPGQEVSTVVKPLSLQSSVMQELQSDQGCRAMPDAGGFATPRNEQDLNPQSDGMMEWYFKMVKE